MGVSIAGAVSGLDTASIIKQMMSAQTASRTTYVDQLNLLDWRTGALQSVKTDLLGLKSAATSVQDIFTFPPMGGTSSDSSKISAATTTSSLPGIYTFQNVTRGTVETWSSNAEMSSLLNQTGSVNTLDVSQAWAAAGFSDTPDGSITITVDGSTTRTFNVADYGTPQDLLSAIQNAFSASGFQLTASGAPGSQTLGVSANGHQYAITEDGTNGLLTEAGLNFIDPGATLASLNAYLDDPFSTGSFTINGKTVSVDITTDTLNSLVSKINSAGADVTAFLDPATEKMVLSRTTAGNLDITIANDTAGVQNALKLAGSSSGGTDTTFNLNGVNMTRSSNTFAINGTTFNLLQNTAAGESVTVNVAQDVDSMVNEIQSWIDKYNSIMTTTHNYLTEEKVKDATTDADKKKGMLRNDSTLRMIYSDLYSMTGTTVDGLATTMNNLQAVGIYHDSSGQLTIGDATALHDALTNNAAAVSSLFNGSDDTATPGDERGIAVRLEDLLANFTTTTSGIMDIKINDETDRAKRVQSQLDSFDARMKKTEAAYTKQFADMESALSSLQQQSTEITNLLASINANWNS